MNPLAYAWLIPLLPALGFTINIIFGHRFGRRGGAYLSVALLLLSTLLASALLVQVYRAAPVWDAPGVFRVIEAERDLHVLEEELLELQRVEAPDAQIVAVRDQAHVLADELHHLEGMALVREAVPGFPFTFEIPWVALQGQEGIPFGILLDPLAALMLFMVSLVCLMIHLFSVEYMAGEERYPTFFAYISLFSAAMLAMVMSRNLFHVLLFWELMGVMSYLLIGFFYKRIAAQQAMKKAFLTTKVGDLAFILALAWIYREFGTLDLLRLQALAPEVLSSLTVATGIGLLLFLAAMGKSAQFPLHVWLLDAMEGPTPVSAMIHAATMVAAGVFLIARTYPILELGFALPVVAFVGAVTALFAAALAPAFADIKKILAWSTVSQLGLMFLSLGVFGWTGALFHLITHAFFKALLFLCSGSMIHGSGTQDIFEMNRLARYMPTTRWTFLIGGLSLAGIMPFAGFWSKDEIFLAIKQSAYLEPLYAPLVYIAYASAFLTAFYIARTYIIAFEKPALPSPWNMAPWNQGAFGELGMTADEVAQDLAQARAGQHEAHPEPHEAGPHMRFALWTLAISATVVGLVGSPLWGNTLQRFIYRGPVPHLEPLSAMWPGFILGTIIALSGTALAWFMYGAERVGFKAPERVTQFLQKRLYLDHALYRFVARPFTLAAGAFAWFDRRVLDGLIDFGAWLVPVLGDALRRAQSGRLEHYAWTVAVAALVLVIAVSVGGLQ